jgi:hypothetical protein
LLIAGHVPIGALNTICQELVPIAAAQQIAVKTITLMGMLIGGYRLIILMATI